MKKHLILTGITALLFSAHTLYSCTVFTAEKNGMVLAGNNEDWPNPNSSIHFYPAQGGDYAFWVFRDTAGFPQGGMNERGLFYDITATPSLPVTKSLDKPTYTQKKLMVKCLQEHSTVDEVVAEFDNWNLSFMQKWQLIWADSAGSGCIIEGDTVLYKDSWYQVCTNFIKSITNKPFTDARYVNARNMLDTSAVISVDLFRDICQRTNQTSGWETMYSNVCDLREKKVHLWYRRRFDIPRVIDLAAELAQPYHSYKIWELFPYIRINVPNSGEIWMKNSRYQITWTDNIDDDSLRVLLIKGSVPVAFLGMAPNTGSWNWTVPDSLADGADYKVRLVSPVDPKVWYQSEGKFTITGGGAVEITVKKPNGGEQWKQGTSQIISWTDPVDQNVKVEVYKGNVVAASLPSTKNDGAELWTVPLGLTPGDDYKVRITSLFDTTCFDESDSAFSIVEQAPVNDTFGLVSPPSGPGLEVFPSVFKNRTTIRVKGTGNTAVYIRNLQGRLVAQWEPRTGIFTWQGKDLNKKKVSPGVYMVECSHNKNITCQKVILVK